MIRYRFKDDEILTIKNAKDADPQQIGEALAALAEGAGGHLTPQAVVEAARSRKSVLHRYFEWDDKVAAEAHRVDQARTIVRCIHVEAAETESGSARAFLSIRDTNGTSYRSLGDVIKSHDLQQRVLAAAERDLISFESRYRELTDVCGLVRSAREQISARRSAMGQDQRASA